MRQQRSERREAVRAFDGELRRGAYGAAADMEEDEARDEDGIERDVALLDVLM